VTQSILVHCLHFIARNVAELFSFLDVDPFFYEARIINEVSTVRVPFGL